MTRRWGGRKVMEARAYMATQLPQPCGICSKPVTVRDRWVIGHIKSRSLHPELTWVQSNWRAEHRACSNRTGQAAVIEKARAEGARLARSFPDGPSTQPPPLPFSLPSVDAREDLRWSPENLSQYAWLTDLLTVPSDASPPLYMTPPHPDAVGSYGQQCIEWIESTQKITLRWWQRLALVRQLEHRADGTLCWRVVLESCPRRAGKSVRLRGLALWRMEHAALFGETQTIVHTGSDIAICREIQRQVWRWAEDTAHWTVTRANGKEAVESRDGSRWLVRSQTAVYGYDVCLGLVDEGWDVDPGTVSEGLEPGTLERSSPQLHLTSTAHRKATSLMRTRLVQALTTEDSTTLLMLWGAPTGSDPADPQVWRAASPHWSQDRRAMIEGKYTAALAGQVDPQADDPDPMEGFKAQYLNVWRLTTTSATRGDAVVEAEEWDTLADADSVPVAPPDAVAVESWWGPSTVAFAWRVGARIVVATTDTPDLAQARAVVDESGYTGTVTVGSSLMEDPSLVGLRTRKGEGRTVTAALALRRLLTEGVLRHDGAEHLSGQALALRTVPAADGPRLVSTGRADAVKAAVWAVEAVQSKAVVGRPRILVPTP